MIWSWTFLFLDGGGLPVLPASVGSGDYDGYLAVIPGEVLAEIYVRHGSRLLEGNVRTFLGRSGKVNKGIAATVAKEPAKFFAYNNGIAATASEVTTIRRGGRIDHCHFRHRPADRQRGADNRIAGIGRARKERSLRGPCLSR